MPATTLPLKPTIDPDLARRHERKLSHANIRLTWTGASGAQTMKATCVDLSQSGISASVASPLPEGTKVHLNAPDLRLYGVALVRRCTKDKTGFLMGLEFQGGLRYNRLGLSR